MRRTFLKLAVSAAAVMAVAPITASAQSLMEKAEAGDPIRIGFANEVPWAYPGEGNAPLGFVNAFALGVLAEMGYENTEPVVTDWGGLIPGLRAGRFDIITGGMYILGSRCENVVFSDPMGTFGDAFIVPAGNPMGLNNYEDLLANDATIVTGAGFNIVEVAKAAGIEDSKIMQVPGPTEILAAVRAGRADAGGVTYFTARNLAEQSEGAVEVSDPSQMPEDTLNWVGIAFRPDDTAFVDAFNAAMADYLGTDAMLEAVAEYGYTEAQLPDDGVTTEWVCDNR